MSTDNGNPIEERGVAIKERAKTKKPPLYKVLLHNDDYTSMEFVIQVLQKFFSKTRTDATRVMLLIHHTGMGVAGLYTHDIAETKVNLVLEYAQKHGFPLRCTMERE